MSHPSSSFLQQTFRTQLLTYKSTHISVGSLNAWFMLSPGLGFKGHLKALLVIYLFIGMSKIIKLNVFSHFPWQWQHQTYWTLNPPLTIPSPASPSPQSQSHWLLGRRVRWEKKETSPDFKSNFIYVFFTVQEQNFPLKCGIISGYFRRPPVRTVCGLID